jgi:ketosteroid isomerase-like protein
MTDRDTLRSRREAIVRRHMESENVHDFDATIGTFSHPRYELIALRHLDDGLVVEFGLRGTHHGFAPTGRSFECRMTAFFLFDDEAIVCERVYYDTATIPRQLSG